MHFPAPGRHNDTGYIEPASFFKLTLKIAFCFGYGIEHAQHRKFRKSSAN
jgi:hypothetical protein